MLLQQLVRTSLLGADTSSRLAKIDLLAALLREAAPEEIEIVIAYLSGAVRQAKLGVGWATLQAARPWRWTRRSRVLPRPRGKARPRRGAPCCGRCSRAPRPRSRTFSSGC